MSEDSAQLEPAPPAPAAAGQVISYAARPPSNPAAVLALTVGVFLFVPIIGLLAIRYGRRALAAARDQGAGRESLARRAIALGRANVVIWCLAAVALPPLFVIQRRHARQLQCMSNLRQIGMAAVMYSIDHGGRFPDTLDKVPRYLGGGGALPVYTCPECDGHVEWIKSPTATAVFNELQSGQNPPCLSRTRHESNVRSRSRAGDDARTAAARDAAARVRRARAGPVAGGRAVRVVTRGGVGDAAAL